MSENPFGFLKEGELEISNLGEIAKDYAHFIFIGIQPADEEGVLRVADLFGTLPLHRMRDGLEVAYKAVDKMLLPKDKKEETNGVYYAEGENELRSPPAADAAGDSEAGGGAGEAEKGE
jgi:hypothetical protein